MDAGPDAETVDENIGGKDTEVGDTSECENRPEVEDNQHSENKPLTEDNHIHSDDQTKIDDKPKIIEKPKIENRSESEDKPDEEDEDFHPNATFGDVENCSSLPIVTEVTSLANMDKELDQTDNDPVIEQEEEDEEIEEMLIPNTAREFPEERDPIIDTEKLYTEEYVGGRSDEGPMDSCEFCHILIPSKMMDDHLRIHKQLDEPLPCPKAKCTNEFLTAFDLKNHLLSIHPGTKELIPVIYNCNNCGKEITNLSAFQVHAKHKHPSTVVKCIKELVLTRTRSGEFVCPVCVKCFQTRKIIVKHFNDAHQLAVKLETTIVVGADQASEPNEMEVEPDHFAPRQSPRLPAGIQMDESSPSMLRGALEGFPNIPGISLPSTSHGFGAPGGEQEAIVCPSCNEVYYDMAAFKRHYYRHTVRYTCRVCNKKIMGMAEYKEHCSKHINRPRAPGEVKRTCPYCGKSFIDMKIHLRKHESSCELCGLQFVHLNNMNRHYLDVHGIDLSQFAKMPDGPQGRKMNTSLDVKLDGYHKTLASIEQFEAEIPPPVAIKTERMEITCEFCSVTYPSQELYNRHVITHNQKCKLCQSVIDNELNIRHHLKNCHGINDVDNAGSLFEPTIFAEITDPAPIDHSTPQPSVTAMRGDKRDSFDDSNDLGKGQKRDSLGRAECKICYRKVIDMNSHMMTHNVKCSLCEYISLHRFNLRPHMRQAHGLNDDEIDALIEDIVANPVQIWDIPPENRIHNRPGAGQSRPPRTPESSISPANSSPTPPPQSELNKEQCQYCSRTFNSQNMKIHVQTSHNVRCRRCGKFFRHQASIYGHMKLVHNVTDFEQMKRDTVFSVIDEDEDFEGGSMSEASHILEEEEEPPRKKSKAEAIPKTTPTLSKPVKPQMHIQSPKAGPSSGKGKKCKVCKQVFGDIVAHMNTHYKPCPLCATQFHPAGFRQHLKQKHGITDPAAVKSLEEDGSDEEEEEEVDVKGHPEERDETPETEIPSPVQQQSITVHKVTAQKSPYPIESGRCDACHKNVRDLHDHRRTRHNLKCLLCKTVIKHFGNIKSHMATIHGLPDADVRELTVATYRPPAQDPHGPLEVSNSVLDLSNDVSIEVEENRIQCEFCDVSLKNRKYYAQHCRNIHKFKLPDKRKERSSNDDFGKDDFPSHFSGSHEFTTRQHLVSNNEISDLGKKDSSDRSLNYSQMLGALSTHAQNVKNSHDSFFEESEEGSAEEEIPKGEVFKPYQCDKCSQRFLRRRYLWRHCKVHHNEPAAYLRYREAGLLPDSVEEDSAGPGISPLSHEMNEASDDANIELPEEGEDGGEGEEVAEEDTIIDNMKIDNEELFQVDVESEILKGVTTQSEITRRRRLLAKHKTSLRIQGGLGFGSYKCKHCHRRFTTSSALVRHLRHDSCPMVLLKLQRREKLLSKGQKFKGKSMANSESNSKSPITTSEFRCDICKIYLSSHISLQRHFLTHTNQKPIKCCKCLKGFNQNIHLRCHLARYHGVPIDASRNIGIENRSIQIQLFQKFNPSELINLPPPEKTEMTCMFCQNSFTDFAALKEHMFVHGKTMPFPCSHCSRGYENEAQLKTHLLRVHSVNKPVPKASPVVSRNDEEKECMSEESDMDEQLPIMKPNLCCFRCRTTIRNIDENIAHNKSHKSCSTRNYCYVCWSQFSHLRSLARHFLTIHSDAEGSDDVASNCRICNVMVMNLPKHVRQCHPDVNMDFKPCKCHYCGQVFTSLIQRKVHLLVKHADNSKHKSMQRKTQSALHRLALSGNVAARNILNRSKQRSSSALKGSTSEYAGEERSSTPSGSEYGNSKSWCSECNKTYVNIRCHRVCHTGIDTFTCKICGRIYASIFTLKRHMRTCNDYSPSPSIQSSSTSFQDSDATANYKPTSAVVVDGVKAASGGFCHICECNIPIRLNIHLNKVHRRGSPPAYRCEYCGRMFRQSLHKRRHQRKEHPEKMNVVRPAVPKQPEEATDELERAPSRSSTSSEIQLRNLRVMLERVDGIKAEPEDWTMRDESNDQNGGDDVSAHESDAAAAVNSEANTRVSPTPSRSSSRDGRPSIFELINQPPEDTGADVVDDDGKLAETSEKVTVKEEVNLNTEPDEKAESEQTLEEGELRYVQCTACTTYLPTRKTDEQLSKFGLLCNSCLKVDATKLTGPSSASAVRTKSTETFGVAKKSTNPNKHFSPSGQNSPDVSPAKPRVKPRSRNVPGSPFLPKPKPKRRNQATRCSKCGMKFMNKSAYMSHDRLIHYGPNRLREGVQLTGNPRCEFCGFVGPSSKKTGHLRKYHPELFMNGVFNKNSEKELKLARILGRADTDPVPEIQPIPTPGETVQDVIDSMEDEDVAFDDEFNEDDIDDEEEEEEGQYMESPSDGPPDLEYQGGTESLALSSPSNGAPHIGSPVVSEFVN